MREKILGKIDQLSEHQLELVITILEEANRIRHSELTDELKAYLTSEIKKEWQETEQDNTKEVICRKK